MSGACAGWGVDGCRGGWFFFALRGRRYSFGLVPTVAEILEQDEPGRLLIDMPIGLHDEDGAPRGCDRLARALLGPRHASVFNAPIRAVLGQSDYATANRRSRQLSGRGLSRQTFNIMTRIAELDTLLQRDLAARAVVREAHPEVCFWGLNGCRPMAANKKTAAGFDERLATLGAHWPDAEAAVGAALADFPRSRLARDDVVDALALALVAAQPARQLRTLPATPPSDSHGLPMEMVYWVRPGNADPADGG